MTFNEIIKAIMNKCNVDDDDTQAIEVIKLGINEAYMEVAKYDELVTSSKIPIIMGKASVPDNILKFIDITPKLLVSDKIIGRTIITSLEDKMLTVTYSYIPDSLTKDTDVLVTAPKFNSAIINYACYSYYLFKKKEEVATMFFSAFSRIMDQMQNENILPNQIEEVYSI